jgi:hypothetical protein
VKLFDWLVKVGVLRAPKPPKGKLCCIDCGRGIHKHERYQIIAAKHRDCGDPKMIGQASLRVINGETVLLPAGAVMGAEMLNHGQGEEK